MKVFVAWVGSLQLELIQPKAGDLDIDREGLSSGDEPMRLHHIGALVDGDLAGWGDVRADLSARTIAMEDPRGPIRFVYIDESRSLGHYIGYVWIDPAHTRTRPEGQSPTLGRVTNA